MYEDFLNSYTTKRSALTFTQVRNLINSRIEIREELKVARDMRIVTEDNRAYLCNSTHFGSIYEKLSLLYNIYAPSCVE